MMPECLSGIRSKLADDRRAVVVSQGMGVTLALFKNEQYQLLAGHVYASDDLSVDLLA